MTDPPPVVADDLLERTERRLRGALRLAATDPVPGPGLVGAFAHLAGVVGERVNRALDKNMVAFLDLVGVSRRPPQPARAPVTFTLATGAGSAHVPAGTRVAAPAEGPDTPEVVYETERGLVAAAAAPVAAFAWEPDAGALEDMTLQLTGAPAAAGPTSRPDLNVPILQLGFSVPFPNAPVALYLDVPPATGAPVPEERRPARGRVVWEYLDADGWTALEVRDDTGGLRRRGLVEFVGPADLSVETSLGTAAAWLRLRMPRRGGSPWQALRAIRTNTTWAAERRTLADEVLGSGTGEPRQRLATAAAPVLPGELLEVREHDGAWVRWAEVPDFAASDALSRHYVLDRIGGRVEFGDGVRGMAPPAGTGSIRISYRAGGGPAGNRAAGQIKQLKTALPYVAGVSNPEPAVGGTAGEDLEAAKARGPRELRHRGRAVALSDFEDLALDATPEVARALVVPAAGAATRGRVGVVVVPRLDVPRPVADADLLERVQSHLEARSAPTVELWVAGPGWLEVSVTATIAPMALEDAAGIEAAVVDRLESFLHPLRGGPGGGGWPLGQRPHRSEVIALVTAIAGVDHVRELTLTTRMAAEPPLAGAFLVASGTHSVTLDEDA